MATFDDLLKAKLSDLSKNHYSDKSPYDDGSPLGIRASMSQTAAIKRVWRSDSGKAYIIKWLLFATTMAALRNERGKIYDPTNVMGPIVLPDVAAGPALVALFGIKPAYLDIIYKEIMRKGYKDDVIDEDNKWIKDVENVGKKEEKKSDFLSKAVDLVKEVLTGKKEGVDKTEPYRVVNDFNDKKNMVDHVHAKTVAIMLSHTYNGVKKAETLKDNVVLKRSDFLSFEKKLNYLYGSIVVIGDRWHDAKNCFVDLGKHKIEELSNLQYFPFYIKDIRKRSAILLNAYFDADDLSEKFNISFNEIKMLHRINVVNTWVSTKKDYSLKFQLFAFDREDYEVMHKKLQYLRDLAYPICDARGIIRSPACILKVKLGNFLNNKNDTGLLMFLTNMSFSFKNMIMDDLIDAKFNNRHMVSIVEMSLVSIDEYPSSFEENPFNEKTGNGESVPIGDYVRGRSQENKPQIIDAINTKSGIAIA